MRAIVYLRQSLDREGNHLGVERQLQECQKLCAARGWQIVRTITENNTSASSGKRPGYREAVQAIQRSDADVIVVLRLDRLLRKLTDLEQLIELGVQVATVQGDLDLTNSSGRLIGRILASVARSEMETKSERHKLANQQKAQAGKPHGSRRPYGYGKDLVTIYEPEAAVLRDMATKLIAGWSYKEIAYWLNEQGHTTTTGKQWFPITVRNLLGKRRYGGIREYDGQEYAATWAPVFDAVTWERLQTAIRLRKPFTGSAGNGLPQARRFLLTGLLYCGKCGTPLNGSTKRDRAGAPLRRVYTCRVQGDTQRKGGCGGVRRNADALDDYIRELVFYRLDTPDLAKLLSAGEADDQGLRDLLDERKAQEQRIEGLVDDYATGLLTRQELARAKERGEAELRRIQADIDRLTARRGAGMIPAGESVRAAWEKSGSDEWRRSFLRLLIERIDVMPSNRKPLYVMRDGRTAKFDSDAIAIKWVDI